jgi:hypothetical protein
MGGFLLRCSRSGDIWSGINLIGRFSARRIFDGFTRVITVSVFIDFANYENNIAFNT